jgi:hypothetical protein
LDPRILKFFEVELMTPQDVQGLIPDTTFTERDGTTFSYRIGAPERGLTINCWRTPEGSGGYIVGMPDDARETFRDVVQTFKPRRRAGFGARNLHGREQTCAYILSNWPDCLNDDF